MIGISELFKRIQNARARELMARASVVDAVKKHTGASIPMESISFSSSTVNLKNVSQVARSVIFIKKVDIMKDINLAQTIRVITDIR